MHRNSSPVSTKQQRVAELAKQSPQRGFTSLAYLMDIDWLHEAFRRTRKDGAAGVDGQTGADYEKDLGGMARTLGTSLFRQTVPGFPPRLLQERVRFRSPFPRPRLHTIGAFLDPITRHHLTQPP
jgi:hypothetical protein